MSVWKVWNTILKSKTMIFSLALTVFSVVELNMQLFMGLLGPTWYPIIFTLVAIVVAWLRTVTTTSLVDK